MVMTSPLGVISEEDSHAVVSRVVAANTAHQMPEIFIMHCRRLLASVLREGESNVGNFLMAVGSLGICLYSAPSSAGYKINNAQAGLLTCSDCNAFPSDRRTVAMDCRNLARNSQQRELLPTLTVFPFNSIRAHAHSETDADAKIGNNSQFAILNLQIFYNFLVAESVNADRSRGILNESRGKKANTAKKNIAELWYNQKKLYICTTKKFGV